MKTSFLPAVTFIALASVAVAQPTNGDSNSNQTGARTDDKGERLICRWVNDPDVGSLVQGRTRRCLTAEQWRALRGR